MKQDEHDSSMVDKAPELPVKIAIRWGVLPIASSGTGPPVLLMKKSASPNALQNVRSIHDVTYDVRLVDDAVFDSEVRVHYGFSAAALDEISPRLSSQVGTGSAPLATEAAMVRFVNNIFTEAIRLGATDIHIEPFEMDVLVRLRVDGFLRELDVPAGLMSFYPVFVSRIKVMARMNVAEKRLPQDGRLSYSLGSDQFDFRVSSLPTMNGESLTLRILPKKRTLLDIECLGFSPAHLMVVSTLMQKPNGLLLVTGPTGHGKTTTLYSLLAKINSPSKKIITIEDPIEIRLKRVNQTQTNLKQGFGFANGLRAILRQDPDVIMIGEIRDEETAAIAIRAALTGHLVLSTLHTSGAAGAVCRLMDMGVAPYLVASALTAVIGERLVRLCCVACKTQEESACKVCGGSGFKNREGLFEILAIDQELKELIATKPTLSALQRVTLRKKMARMFDHGMEKVAAGLTTLSEINRVVADE